MNNCGIAAVEHSTGIDCLRVHCSRAGESEGPFQFQSGHLTWGQIGVFRVHETRVRDKNTRTMCPAYLRNAVESRFGQQTKISTSRGQAESIKASRIIIACRVLLS